MLNVAQHRKTRLTAVYLCIQGKCMAAQAGTVCCSVESELVSVSLTDSLFVNWHYSFQENDMASGEISMEGTGPHPYM